MKKTLLSVFASVLLLGVFAFADQDSTWSNHAWTGNAAFTGTSTAAIACVKTALDNREAGVKWAMDTYYATWGTAFTARGIALTDALFLPTRQEIKKATNVARKTYKTAMITAKKAKKGTIQAAWNAYRAEVKLCKGDVAKVLKDQNGKSDLSD